MDLEDNRKSITFAPYPTKGLVAQLDRATAF